jgi:peroxiredoxin
MPFDSQHHRNNPTILLTIALLAGLAGCEPKHEATHNESPGATKIITEPTNGRSVLERTVAAYKNCKTYSDYGVVTFQAEIGHGPVNQQVPFEVAFERPNKLHMHVNNGEVRCDGQRWFATSNQVPGQYIERDAPAAIRPTILEADGMLHQALAYGIAGRSLQAILLTYDDPLKILLEGSEDVQLEESGKIGDRVCYRVSIQRKDGIYILWIDRESFIVRQMVVPSDDIRREMERQGPVKSVSIVATFDRAQFDVPIPQVAFQFEAPAGAQRVRVLTQPSPVDLLGQKLPEFHFKDLNGVPWSSKSLTGKTVMLEFWSSDCQQQCLEHLPKMQEIYETYKDNNKVAVFAVCLDGEERKDSDVQAAAKGMMINVPILRDVNKEAGTEIHVIGPPTTLFIDSQGVLQDCILGGNALQAAAAPQKMKRLLAGESLVQEALAKLHQKITAYEQDIDKTFSGAATVELAIDAKAAPAAKTAPKTFHLVPLWKSTDVRPAGNILALQQTNGSTRLVVIDSFNGLAEFTPAGKFLASHKPQLEPEEFFTNIRAASGADGKQWIAGFAPIRQRLHLFDENLKPVLSYPADALTNRHDGISDVQLGDLDGDGLVKMYVSYWGTVGVQAVSLDGHRLRSYRNLLNISHIAIGPADSDRKRDLYCVNESGSLGVLDARLQLHNAVTLPAQMFLQALTAGDLLGDGQYSWCGISLGQDRQLTALGLNLRGEVLWNFPLPKGAPQPVESILIGGITPGGPKHWIIPGCDGSINVVAADGQVVDRFNYGAAVTGVATYLLDGKAVIAVASQDGVEAFKIEPL